MSTPWIPNRAGILVADQKVSQPALPGDVLIEWVVFEVFDPDTIENYQVAGRCFVATPVDMNRQCFEVQQVNQFHHP